MSRERIPNPDNDLDEPSNLSRLLDWLERAEPVTDIGLAILVCSLGALIVFAFRSWPEATATLISGGAVLTAAAGSRMIRNRELTILDKAGIVFGAVAMLFAFLWIVYCSCL